MSTYTDIAASATTTTQLSAAMLPEDKRGAIYTRPWVVEILLDLAGYDSATNLVDTVAIEPAAGDGAFLLAMARRLVASCRRQGRSVLDCRNALIALEIEATTAEDTRQAVRETLIESGLAIDEAAILSSAWIRTVDALLELPMLPMADFVIGNPPYIRLEDVTNATMIRYRATYKTMTGRADLYIPFFEAALKQLKSGGVCAYICADRWMRNQYGAELRRLVTTAYGVETIVEMHRANVFTTEVSAYPAIVVIRKAEQGPVVVASAGPSVETADSTALARSITALRIEREPLPSIAGLGATRVEKWFEGADPWPCVSPERLALLKHLEESFYPLESAGTGTKVTIGVATGADDIFIIADSELVESGRLLPLAMARDIGSGQVHWSGRYLVNPWEGAGLVDLARYPRLGAYLTQHRERLSQRHVGKKQPKHWYRTIDRVNAKLVGHPKLYIADINNQLNPVLDSGKTYPHHNLYVVTSSGWDYEVLGGLLLSEIAQFFIECYAVRMRGGYLRFQAQYLRRIRVPRPHDVTPTQAAGLRSAFRRRDRAKATAIALTVYGIRALPEEALT